MKCKWHLCENTVRRSNAQYCSDKCKNKYNVTIWTKKRKVMLVDYKGGKCERCGYNKSVAALQLHHVGEKSFGFATNEARGKTVAELKEEADKCILLCANCHAEEHAGSW